MRPHHVNVMKCLLLATCLLLSCIGRICEAACSDRCRNGATCIDQEDSLSCVCAPGWTGLFCDLVIDECASSPCKNNGTCFDGVNSYACQCAAGFQGATCEQDEDECSRVPAVCQNYVSCENTYGSFHCNCIQGYEGDTCEARVSECASTPCMFAGTCVDTPAGYRCICRLGFTGDHCEGVEESCGADNPCSENAICIQNDAGKRQCFCKDGYYGLSCQYEVNECASSPCYNGATCFDGSGTYRCYCPPGYTSADCSVDIDECRSAPCRNGGTCAEPAVGEFTCECAAGWTGATCEDNVDDCAARPCNVTHTRCIDVVDGFRCVCPEGFAGPLCDTPIDYCFDLSPCMNGGTCLTTALGSYSCRCRYPYDGENCEENVDPCFTSICANGATCNNNPLSPRGFTCYCPPGFIGDTCEIDVFDCLSSLCRNGATCIEGAGGQVFCACADGYEGERCESRATNCSGAPCANGGHCTATDVDPGYVCECPPGWEGATCQRDVNECKMASPCSNGGHCVNTPGGYACLCSPYWTGQHCEVDIEECHGHACMYGSCVEQQGRDYACECLDGYTGLNCESELDECESSPCKHNSTCVDGLASYTCVCAASFTGEHCENSVDACTNKPCLRGTCLSLPDGTYKCSCDWGFTGPDCDTELLETSTYVETISEGDNDGDSGDTCERGCVNGGTCVVTAAGAACHCTPGFTGDSCERVRGCASNPCANGATCVDNASVAPCADGGSTCVDTIPGVVGDEDFYCNCSEGYTGALCSEEVSVDFCAVGPCVHGDCVNLNNSYSCLCYLDFSGENCSQPIGCSAAPCLRGGTCVREDNGTSACVCTPGTAGEQCEMLTAASFAGLQLVAMPTRWDAEKDAALVVEFSFATTVFEGVLLLYRGVRSEDRIPVVVAMELRSRPDAVHLIIAEPSRRLDLPFPVAAGNDDTAAVLRIARSHVSLTLHPDGCDFTDACFRSVRFSSSGVIFDDAMLLGGVAQVDSFTRSVLQSAAGFTGCLQDVRSSAIQDGVLDLAELLDGAALSPTPGCARTRVCDEVTCENEGVCVDMWTHARCQCIAGYTGDDCSFQTSATFTNRSLLHFPEMSRDAAALNKDAERSKDAQRSRDAALIRDEERKRDAALWADVIDEVTVSVTLASPERSGSLLYTLGSDSQLAVYMVNASVHVIVLTLAGEVRVNLTDYQLTDGWYTLHVKALMDHIIVKVEDASGSVMAQGVAITPRPLAVGYPLFLGVVHPAATADMWRLRLPATAGFSGCARNLTVNRRPVNLASARGYLGNRVDPPAAGRGCSADRNCDRNPCGGGAACAGTWAGPRCLCPPHLTGETCDKARAFTLSGDDSYVYVAVDTTVAAFGDRGSLEFRTRDVEAPLLVLEAYGGSGNLEYSMNVQIVDSGLLVSTYKAGTLQSSLDLLPSLVSDGAWHTLAWTFSDTGVTIVVDGNHTASFGHALRVYIGDRGPTVKLHVGADPLALGHYSGFMHGCIRNVTLDGRMLLLGAALPGDGIQIDMSNAVSGAGDGCTGRPACASNPCPVNAACRDMWNAHACDCLPGWQGDGCDVSVDDCADHACATGATCVDSHRGYTCACPEGFTGPRCDDVAAACDSAPCWPDSTIACVSVFPGDFECYCRPGFAGKTCGDDVDDCASAPCRNNGTCVDDVGGYSCVCPREYVGQSCERYSACSSDPCLNEGECSDAEATFTCRCVSGFGGARCEDYDWCLNASCSNGATCRPDARNYSCECAAGYTGALCERVDRCASAPCQNNGTCVADDERGFACVCAEHHQGALCEEAVDRCESSPCLNGGSCWSDGGAPAAFACECTPGWEGARCETDIAECESSPCLNNGTCIDSATAGDFFPGYSCTCAEGYSGDTCAEETDECVGAPCKNNGTCLDLVAAYSCECVAGFSGVDCEMDIRRCSSSPCVNNGTCETDDGGEQGGYACRCAVGFTGALCGTNIDDCGDHRCANGRCVDGAATYTCECEPGFGGALCDEVMDACYSAPCANNGTCSYVGLCSCHHVVARCGWHDETCQLARCLRAPGCKTHSRSYNCDCAGTGYAGALCERDVDECSDGAACVRGVCVNAPGSYACDCAGTGYAGALCERDVDECMEEAEPCGPRAACVNAPGSYTCVCPPFIASPCRNGGGCAVAAATKEIACNCTGTGYAGRWCSDDVDECQGALHACHGAATCVNHPGNYSCVCSEEYTGTLCDTSIGGEAAPLSARALAILLPFLVILLCLAAVVIWSVWYVRRSRKMKGKYRPSVAEESHGVPIPMTTVPQSNEERLV